MNLTPFATYRVGSQLDLQYVGRSATGVATFIRGMFHYRFSDLDLQDKSVREQTTDDPLGLVGCTIVKMFTGATYEVTSFKDGLYTVHLSVSYVTYPTQSLRNLLEQHDVEVRDSIAPPKSTPPPAIHAETVSFYRGQDVPDRVYAEAIDRGERAVRRTLRVWPFGQKLLHRESKSDTVLTIEWFWQSEEV